MTSTWVVAIFTSAATQPQGQGTLLGMLDWCGDAWNHDVFPKQLDQVWCGNFSQIPANNAV